VNEGTLILAWVVAGAVAVLGIVLARRRYDFAILVARDGGVRFRGRFPASRRGDVADFFRSPFAPPGPLRVFGTWQHRGRRLKLRFRGVPSQPQQQVVRNFLTTTLGILKRGSFTTPVSHKP
jgi:hypothetical protein